MRITYSTDLLRQMWSPDQRPSRMLRKTLFNARIWCPANCRSQRCLPAALSRGASSSSTQPDDFLDRSPPPASSPHPPASPRPTSTSVPGIRAATWNAHSINGKSAYVAHTLQECQLDIFTVTETWHQETDDVPVQRAAPPGYSIRDRPRPPLPDGRLVTGGGIVVFHRSSLRSSVIPLDMELSTFEALCLSIATSHGPITLLSIYRPGSEVPTRQFFDQFSSVLECLITRNSQLLIMGDFNLPLKDQTDPDSISFRDILSQFGLRQHINETTHKLGGFLDLVITADNEQVRDLKVQPPTISDHAYIQFWLPHLHSQPLHAIRKTRGWRSLDRRMLSDALRSSQLSSSPSTLDAQTVDELFDLYTSTMNQLIDTMLPLRELKTRCRPLAVWFDSDCQQIRRRSRCLERRFRRTRDPADKLAWITQLRALHQLYRRKEAAYWENLVKRNEKNPKRLWTSISGLMGRSSRPPEDPSFTASDFFAIITTKMENLRASTADSPPPFFASTDCSLSLMDFDRFWKPTCDVCSLPVT